MEYKKGREKSEIILVLYQLEMKEKSEWVRRSVHDRMQY